MNQQVSKWADQAMFEAEPSDITPRATVISMTPIPLQTMAAACEMYKGVTVRHPSQVPKDTALEYLSDLEKTTLKAPLEFIDIHLLLEGVTRGFTHQLVRQRTAVYVQESTRFAVKRGAAKEVVRPPSLAGLPDDHPMVKIWTNADAYDSWAYNALIDAGMPAEDARGRLVHNIATRVHYKSNLRNLQAESGKRLCSQAQFEWKQVWVEIVAAIREYGPDEERWQQVAISNIFKPICYMTGKCEFMAATDRACSIRDRVEKHHHNGDPPSMWSDINQFEPIAEGAARVR
jgi:thymidylate synthase ThyX